MTKSPKILSVNVSDSSGGAARAAYRIQQAVNENGGNSRMLVKHKGLDDERILVVNQFDKTNRVIDGFRLIQKKFKNKLQQYHWNKYPNKEDVFMSDLRSESLHHSFQKIDFDILHLHWINLRFLDLNELQKVNKPIVWTLHDSWAFTGICHYFYECTKYKESCGSCPFLHSENDNDFSRIVWKQKRKLYKGLNLHIVTPSNWLANAARQSSLFGHFPITVIPNPINTAKFTPVNKEDTYKLLNLSPDKKYILFGAIHALKDKNKGFQELLSALNYILGKDANHNIELLVFGAEKFQDDLFTKFPIRFLGVIDNDVTLASAYSVASVTVVPSLSENLSNTIMESLSCGTPVVSFDIGGNSDMIDHKKNGYLAKEKDSEDLGQGILWCLDNNNENQLSMNARKKVEENFSQGIVAKKYMELYKSLI